ncbi:MAG: hypothetical protein JSV00_08315 [bacterium]|nr:MAG: hypothetical protein JSV00_08315 [bacterium]
MSYTRKMIEDYTKCREPARLDLYLSHRDLRPQFDEIDVSVGGPEKGSGRGRKKGEGDARGLRRLRRRLSDCCDMARSALAHGSRGRNL